MYDEHVPHPMHAPQPHPMHAPQWLRVELEQRIWTHENSLEKVREINASTI